MGTAHDYGEGRLERTDSFLPSDEVDLFFVSHRTHHTCTWAAITLFASLVCAILSLV